MSSERQYDEWHDLETKGDKPQGYDIVKAEDSPLSIIYENVINDGNYFLSTLPSRSHKEKLAIARHMTTKENNIEDILEPKFFNVTNFILSKATFTDKDGETVTTPKLVLIDDTGRSIAVLAKVFVSDFIGLLRGIGLPPWEEPLCISAKLCKGNGANRYYSLNLP